jgi:hypothetical protein
VIPRRKGFYYKITYEDGDQEDMDEDELIFAIQLKLKKDRGEEVHNEAEVLSGLSEEGSEYDSEDDRKTLKEARKRRQVEAARAKSGSKKQRNNASKATLIPESVANVGVTDLILEDFMLGKYTSRYGFSFYLDIDCDS